MMAADTFTRDISAWQYQVLSDRRLTLLALHVACAIREHINRDTRDAWPSQGRLANFLQISRRGLQKAIDQLRAHGHLEVTVNRGRGGSNRYRPRLQNVNGGTHYAADNANHGTHQTRKTRP